MSELLGKVADALAQTFREAVERAAGESFEKTSVTLPGKEVWKRYARAAVLAIREPTDEMFNAAETSAGAALDADYKAMIDAALAG